MGPKVSDASPAPSVLEAVRAAVTRLGGDPSGDPDAMMDRESDALREPLLGVVVAAAIPVGAYGLLEYGMRASATVGDAVQRLARHYASVSSRVRAEVAVLDGRSALVFHRRAGVTFSRHWLELPAAAIARRLTEGAGAPVLDEVRFRHRSPGTSHDARYLDAFGAPVVFQAKQDALVFLDGALGAPMVTAAAPVAASVDAELRALEAQTAFPDPLHARIRAAVADGLGEGIELKDVAHALRMSPRTLQRALKDRGTSFSAEVDEARRDRALRAVLHDDAKLAGLATDLGFADPSAFFRAFRRWTGTTPGHYASQQRGR